MKKVRLKYIESRKDLITDENKPSLISYYNNLNISSVKDALNLQLLYVDYADKLTEDELRYIKGERHEVFIPDICQALLNIHGQYLEDFTHIAPTEYDLTKHAILRYALYNNIHYLHLKEPNYTDFKYHMILDIIDCINTVDSIKKCIDEFSSKWTFEDFDNLSERVCELNRRINRFTEGIIEYGTFKGHNISENVSLIRSLDIDSLHRIISEFDSIPDKDSFISDELGHDYVKEAMYDPIIRLRYAITLTKYDKSQYKFKVIRQYIDRNTRKGDD